MRTISTNPKSGRLFILRENDFECLASTGVNACDNVSEPKLSSTWVRRWSFLGAIIQLLLCSFEPELGFAAVQLP